MAGASVRISGGSSSKPMVLSPPTMWMCTSISPGSERPALEVDGVVGALREPGGPTATIRSSSTTTTPSSSVRPCR